MTKPAILVIIGGLLIGVTGPNCWAQNDSLQNKVSITAMTYDDGFGVPLKDPAAIWFDRWAHEVFVADAGNHRVIVYDTQLTATFSFRHFVKERTSGQMVPGEPRSMAVNSDGEILLIDGRSDRLELLDFRGHYLTSVKPAALLGDTALRVTVPSVSIDIDGFFYVLVTGDVTCILKLNRDLSLVRQIGEKGIQPGQLNTPVSISIWRGKIFVGDLYGLPAVKVFDSLGQFLYGFAGHDVERQDLSMPVGIGFLDSPSTGFLILVADGLRQAVKVYKEDGRFVTIIGGFGYLPGLLQYPSGLSSDGVSAFYVVERTGGRLQRYKVK
jgi:hypothetical protein